MKDQMQKLLKDKANYTPVPFDKQIHRVGDKIWRVATLVELAKAMPVVVRNIEDIRAINLNLPLLKHHATHLELAYHVRVAMAANLDFPVILGQDGRVMDGHHRIIKTLACGLPNIKLVQFKIDPEPDMYATGSGTEGWHEWDQLYS